MKLRRLTCRSGLAAVATAVGLAAFAPLAGAHPLGNFTVNHYAGIVVSPNVVRLDYVLDLAEIPAFQEQDAVRAAGDDASYATAKCAAVAPSLDLQIDGRAVAVQPAANVVSFPAGQGGLHTLRLECAFDAPTALTGSGHTVRFEDRNYGDRIGWRELTMQGEGVTLRTDLPSSSISDRLTSYPQDDVSRVPRSQVGEATVDVTDATAGAAALPLGRDGRRVPGAAQAPKSAVDPFTKLIARGDRGVWAMLGALAVAAAIGATHGLAPGHGKTVVAAYLVGTRGSRRQAVGLALAVALSHTLGVFALGGLTLAAASTFPLERVYAYLQLASAAIILSLGMWLTRRVLQARRRARRASRSETGHDHHDHHDHDDDDDHHHGHDRHDHGAAVHAHQHRGSAPARVLVGASGLQQLATGATANAGHRHDHGAHAHGHGHGHDHENHDHENHDHGAHGHDHGSHGHHGLLPHRHRVAWDSLDLNQPLGWRALIALGLSGGILPSASAVIVLLGAVQLGRVGFGAALILAFGVGLSAALVGVGVGVVAVARRAQHRFDAHAAAARFSALLAPVAAFVLVVLGLWFTARALTVL